MSNQVPFDWSPLTRFWAVTDKLTAGETVTGAEWEALFATPGYRALRDPRFSPANLQPRFELAFGQGREGEARAAAESDPLVAHYLMVREHREPLQAFYRELDPAAAFGEALALAARWLPQRFLLGSPAPTVTALVFSPAGTGDNPILWDALFAYYLGRNHLVLAAGHSLHHHYRGLFRRPLPGLSESWAYVVDMIQAEGIADLINVERWVFQGGPLYAGGPLGNSRWVTRLREGLDHASEALTLIDRALVAAPDAREQLLPDVYRALPGGGHGPGFHMARQIVRAGLVSELVEGCADPVSFFDLYRQACLLLDEPGEISAEAVAALAATAGIRAGT